MLAKLPALFGSCSEQPPFERSISSVTVPMASRRLASLALQEFSDKMSASAMKKYPKGAPRLSG
jgi:hypothetical protein